MGLINGVFNFAGNLVGGLFGGGHQYARSSPAGQGSLGHSSQGMKHSWPGWKDSFKGLSQSKPGNSANAPGQMKKAEDHTSADVKPVLGTDAPQQAPKPVDPKATAPAAPAGPPEVTGRKGPAGNDPKISQFAPTGAPAGYDGTEACGPTVGAMVARNIGYTPDGNKKPTDADLIADLGKAAGTTPTGTTGNGMIAMFEHMGMDTNATKGANLDWMTSELQAGHHVVALGNYYAVPGRTDQGQGMTSGHYLDITGVNKDGSFEVNDPADTSLTSMTRDQMQNFIATAPQGGFAVSAWKPTGAAAVG